MTERVWQMTRLAAGDYLLPSNDGRSLWRISRYYEDGSLERYDGTKVVGYFWRAARHRDPFNVIAPLLAEVSADDLSELLLDWDAWVENACLLKTRGEAIDAALNADVIVGDQWLRYRWENEHAADCPITRHRADLLKQLARLAPTDLDYPVLAGAVPEYQPDGDQEADLCECGVVERQ